MESKIYAVIHSRNQPEAHYNAQVAIDSGVDGVFFISHGELDSIRLRELIDNFERDEKIRIGANFLGYKLEDIIHLTPGIDMIWSDYTPTGEELERFLELRKNYNFEFFGGVAFKYQPQPKDLFQAGKDSVGIVDVLTTSGPGTGQAPELNKLSLLSDGFGGKIAVASGTTPENVKSMLPWVDCFLVSTGISKDFYTIDSNKCKKLVDVASS